MSSAVIEEIKHLNEAAIAAKKAGDIEAAIQLLKDALKINPHPTTYINLGVIYFSQENYVEAESVFEKITKPYPEKFAFYFYYGRSLAENQRQDVAICFLEQALRLDPHSLYAQAALAYCYFFIGEHEKSQFLYEKIVNSPTEPSEDFIECCTHLYFSYLVTGNFYCAKIVEEKILAGNFLLVDDFSVELWRGQTTRNESIFVISNEGVGDDLAYSAYLPQLKNYFDRVFFECDSRLVNFFRKNFTGINFIAKGEVELRKKALRQAQFTNSSYQLACHLPVEDIKPLVAETTKFSKKTVGISYSSTAKDAKKRMPPLDFWNKLFEQFPDIDFVNLQDNQSVKASAKFFLDDHPRVKKIEAVDLYNDFENLAALINGCDYLISIDNSIAHLAGRLNKSCAVLLSTGCDWRWCNDRFYPAVTKIKQKEYGKWESVFEELALCLEKLFSPMN